MACGAKEVEALAPRRLELGTPPGKKIAWFAASLCHEPDGRTDGHFFLFGPAEVSRDPRVLLEEL